MKLARSAIYLICLMLFILGCSKKTNKACDTINETDEIQLVVHQVISDNLSVDIDRKFKSQALKKYWVQAEPYPVNREWAQNIADKYYKPEIRKQVSELEGYEKQYGTRAFSIQDEKGDFSAVGNDIFISIDRDFYDNCEAYYHSQGLYPFFNDEMDTYYNQADLPFMTYEEARILSKSLLTFVGFTYNEKTCKGYSLSESALMKYQASHQERFSALEDSLDQIHKERPEMRIGNFIKSWEGTGGFYIFYYPIEIEGMNVDEETFNTIMYAHVVINASGIARAQVPCPYKVKKSESVTIVKPEIVLDKLIEMYDNTILTSTVVIDDMELTFAQIAIENMHQLELDVQYVIAPVWKFKVLITEDGKTIEGSVLYDATTGEQVG